MRSSCASSLIRQALEAGDQRRVPAFGDANRGAPACGEAQAAAGPKLKSQHLACDLPAWAAAVAGPRRRSVSQTRGVGVPDHDGGNICADDRTLLNDERPHSKRRSTMLRGRRLEPLLTVAETATTLNVSERTVRRLIASGTIRGIWIGRSVRLRPRDIERCIAGRGTYND